jgi:hypothetical protein
LEIGKPMLTASRHARRLAGGVVCLALCVAVVPSEAQAQLQCHVGTIRYHDGGGIKACEIEADHQFYTPRGDRLRCRRGHDVVLHPNGAVAACTIGEPHVFAGVACAGPGRVELAPDGTLRKCE